MGDLLCDENLRDLLLNAQRLEEVAGEIVPAAMERTGANGGSLLIRDGDELVVYTAFGLKTNRARQARIPLGVGVTGRAAREGKSQWVPDVTAEENYIEGVSDSVWELAVPLNDPSRGTGLVLDLESDTDRRPGEDVREQLASVLRGVKTPLLTLAENERLRRTYQEDSLSAVMDGEFFLDHLRNWFSENPDRSGLLVVTMLEPRLESLRISSYQELRTEMQSLGSELNTLGCEDAVTARLYGNLFATVVPDVREVEAPGVREDLLETLRESCRVKQVNSCHWGGGDQDVESLLNTAFVSLNYKENGRKSTGRSNELDEILRSGDINLSRQPIVETESGEVVGHEILVRGPEDSRLQSPKKLFQAAYQEDRVVELDSLITRRALLEYRGDPGNRLFLNVERKSLVDARWRESLVHLFQNGTGVQNLCVEITEHGNMTELREPLNEIRGELNSSVNFAIDDFGTGSSNFEAIIELDPDLLKIDRSLIRNLHQEFGKRSLIESILNFSTTTDFSLLAEGIETEAEWSEVRDLGLRWAQGYYFEEPQPLQSA